MNQEQYDKLTGELQRLSTKYHAGKQLKIVWNPDMDDGGRAVIREQLGLKEEGKLKAQVVGDRLIIYERDFDKAMHVLRREFFEWWIQNRFERGYELMLKLMEKGITRMVYDDKQEALERMAEMEGLEYKRISRKTPGKH